MCYIYIQCSSFITLCLGSIGMNPVISESTFTKDNITKELQGNEHLMAHFSIQQSHSKIDKSKILMPNGSLMKVKSIAECSKGEHSAILLTCIYQ